MSPPFMRLGIHVHSWQPKLPPGKDSVGGLFFARATFHHKAGRSETQHEEEAAFLLSEEQLEYFNDVEKLEELLNDILKHLPTLHDSESRRTLASFVADEFYYRYVFSPEFGSGDDPYIPIICISFDAGFHKLTGRNRFFYNRPKVSTADSAEIDHTLISLGKELSDESVLRNLEAQTGIHLGDRSIKMNEIKPSLKSEHYRSQEEDESEENICPICIEAFTEGTPVIRTACSHKFHRACLFTWLSTGDSCPMCRSGCLVGF